MKLIESSSLHFSRILVPKGLKMTADQGVRDKAGIGVSCNIFQGSTQEAHLARSYGPKLDPKEPMRRATLTEATKDPLGGRLMRKNILRLLVVGATAFILNKPYTISAYGHCEIPCGIYGDEARFTALAEDIKTIEKSILQITELSHQEPKNYNQLVRWVNNKETHANHIREVVSQYFLAQRIKPAAPEKKIAEKKYGRQLKLLHKLIVHAMKAKQTTDLDHVEALNTTLTKFKKLYFSKGDAPLAKGSHHKGHGSKHKGHDHSHGGH